MTLTRSGEVDLSNAGKTFGIKTAQDLLAKLRHEADYVWGGGVPADPRLRTYAILNCAITAWQIKDWVFAALRTQGRLDVLARLAGRSLKDERQFGQWLCGQSRPLSLCHQIATATKHFEVTRHNDPLIHTASEERSSPFREDGKWTELMIIDGEEVYVAEDLMFYVCAIWNTIFRDLGLSDEVARQP